MTRLRPGDRRKPPAMSASHCAMAWRQAWARTRALIDIASRAARDHALVAGQARVVIPSRSSRPPCHSARPCRATCRRGARPCASSSCAFSRSSSGMRSRRQSQAPSLQSPGSALYSRTSMRTSWAEAFERCGCRAARAVVDRFVEHGRASANSPSSSSVSPEFGQQRAAASRRPSAAARRRVGAGSPRRACRRGRRPAAPRGARRRGRRRRAPGPSRRAGRARAR